MRRYLALGIVLALLLPATGETQAPTLGQPWTCAVDNVADTIARCVQAPEPGLRLYVTDVIAQSTTSTAGKFGVLYNQAVALGGAADCGTEPLPLFPPGVTFESTRFVAAANTLRATSYAPRNPLIVPAGNDLCVIGNADNAVTVQLVGYVAP